MSRRGVRLRLAQAWLASQVRWLTGCLILLLDYAARIPTQRTLVHRRCSESSWLSTPLPIERVRA